MHRRDVDAVWLASLLELTMKKRGGREMPKELLEDMSLFIYPQYYDWWKYVNIPLKSFC